MSILNKEPSYTSPVTTFPERYIERVRRVRAVSRVILCRTESGLSIWTILDQDPSNRELRAAIYEIEAAVLREFPGVQADFRLVNLAEYPEPEQIHVPDKQVIYERGETFAAA